MREKKYENSLNEQGYTTGQLVVYKEARGKSEEIEQYNPIKEDDNFLNYDKRYGDVHMIPKMGLVEFIENFGEIEVVDKLEQIIKSFNKIATRLDQIKLKMFIQETKLSKKSVYTQWKDLYCYGYVEIGTRKYEITCISFSNENQNEDGKGTVNCELNTIQFIRHNKINYRSIERYPNTLEAQNVIPVVLDKQLEATYYNPPITFYDSAEVIALEFLIFIIESERQYAELLKEEEN